MAAPSALQFTHALKVTLTHATDLAVGDYIGKSDPYVALSLDDGQKARSSCRSATLDPVWNPPEHFDFKLREPTDRLLRIDVFDHDIITRDDLLGSVVIPLKDFVPQATEGETLNDAAVRSSPSKKELLAPPPAPAPSPAVKPTAPPIATPKGYTLDVPVALKSSVTSQSQVFLRIAITPLDISEVRLEIWENECWMLGSGWSSDESLLYSHRRRWSPEDGATSCDTFEAIAAKVPLGFQGSGWSFCVGKGDRDGWLYASTFAGPWYAESNPMTLVRRRKWLNVCRRMPSTKALV